MRKLIIALTLIGIACAVAKAPAPVTTPAPPLVTAIPPPAVPPPAPVTVPPPPPTTTTPPPRPPIIPVPPDEPVVVHRPGTVVGDFTIDVTPGTVSVMQSQSAPVSLSVFGGGGFDSAVAFSVIAPTGISTMISPASIPAPGSGNAALAIAAGNNSTLGTNTVRVTATGGTKTHIVPVTVNVTAFQGNCINAKCGNLGTKTYTADVFATKIQPNYIPSVVMFFPSGDLKTGLVADRDVIRYTAKWWPAGFTVASFYYLRTTPTSDNGGIETCAYSGSDGGGICFHRYAGIVEHDAIKICAPDCSQSKNYSDANVLKMVGYPSKVIVDTAITAWLVKYGKYLTPPCASYPCP